MNNPISYQKKEASILIDKMCVTIHNHYPEYSLKDQKIIKTGIENKLFNIFANMDKRKSVKEENNV